MFDDPKLRLQYSVVAQGFSLAIADLKVRATPALSLHVHGDEQHFRDLADPSRSAIFRRAASSAFHSPGSRRQILDAMPSTASTPAVSASPRNPGNMRSVFFQVRLFGCDIESRPS
jgi:hypothetical protein